jgi:hypothetical protein
LPEESDNPTKTAVRVSASLLDEAARIKHLKEAHGITIDEIKDTAETRDGANETVNMTRFCCNWRKKGH